MPSNYALLVMYMRFGLAGNICMIASFVGAAGILLLPKNHPSRLYLAGRICKGRECMNTALSKEAAQAAVETERVAA